MNYALNDGSANPFVTQWTRVKLNYLLISDKFNSYPTGSSPLGANYVWAGSVEITPNKSGDYGLWGPGSIFSTDAVETGSCGYLSAAASTSTAKFDQICPNTDLMIPHYYIMGFQFSPSSVTLAAKAQIPNYLTNANVKAIFGSTDATGYGPIVRIDTFGGALKKLKVAIVLTTIRDSSNYPNTIQGFGYSGIYMPIDITNIWRPVVFGEPSTGAYNR